MPNNSLACKIRYVFLLPRYIKRAFYMQFNILKFKINGITIGEKPRIYDKVYALIKNGGKVFIGDNFHLQSGNGFNPLVRGSRASIYVGADGILTIGNRVGISSACIWCIDSVTIGDYTKIGANTIIMDNDAHNIDYNLRRNPKTDNAKSLPIVIGQDVLIGAGSTILKGVKIGDRVVIGAGSVVTKDIPSDCIAAGNPCRVIKSTNIQKK